MVRKRVTRTVETETGDNPLRTESTGSEVRTVKKGHPILIAVVLVVVLALLAFGGFWLYKPKAAKTVVTNTEQSVQSAYDKAKQAVTPGDQPSK